MKNRVKALRDAGLEFKRAYRRGRPVLFARDPRGRHKHQREQWWLVDDAMWGRMRARGVADGFHDSTTLGDFFSLRV